MTGERGERIVSETDDDFDPVEAAREEPPRIRGPDDFEAVVRFHVGNRAWVHEVEELSDGRLVAHLGVTKDKDTSEGAGEKERTLLNYAPVGVFVAHPADDGEEYVVDVPDHDALDPAIQARRFREDRHRAAVLPAVRNLLEDAVDQHAPKADESSDEFRRGVHIGMARLASVVLGDLEQRWNAPYRGRKRWQAEEDP